MDSGQNNIYVILVLWKIVFAMGAWTRLTLKLLCMVENILTT
jgi:hypothetical protein